MQANAAETRSGRPGQFRLDLFFQFKRPGHGGTLLHAFVVPRTVAVFRKIQPELDGAAPAPHEMRIGRAPLAKKIFPPGEHVVRDFKHMFQFLCRHALCALLGSRRIAEFQGRIFHVELGTRLVQRYQRHQTACDGRVIEGDLHGFAPRDLGWRTFGDRTWQKRLLLLCNRTQEPFNFPTQ